LGGILSSVSGVQSGATGATGQVSAGPNSAAPRFFESEATGGILLLICTITALTWANSRWSATYFHIQESRIGFTWNELHFALSVGEWISDGLMAIFFFVVGLEIKREILIGELSSLRKAALPVAAAAGGMALPALIYIAFNQAGAGARGWGIPMATDIAFAVGILALLGSRVPSGLRIFLTALAIVDDLGAVLVIALFYSGRLSIAPMIAAGILLATLVLMARLGIKRVAIYAVLVIGVWLCVLASGIHTTVAGILLAMVVPVRSRIQPNRFFAVARQRLAELEASQLTSHITTKFSSDEIETLEKLRKNTSDVIPAGLGFERLLHPVTAYVILPLFALFNAGVVLDTGILRALANPVGLGVLLGLLLGKQAGITISSWLVIRCRLADMPAGVSWLQIHGCAILAGIGFTMALFVTDLALGDKRLVEFSKAGILAASALCAAGGYYVLRLALGSTDKVNCGHRTMSTVSEENSGARAN
jgi:Na+:H+ antiporter, NhaA family